MSTAQYEALLRQAIEAEDEAARTEIMVRIGAIIMSSLERIADALESGAARGTLLDVGSTRQ